MANIGTIISIAKWQVANAPDYYARKEIVVAAKAKMFNVSSQVDC